MRCEAESESRLIAILQASPRLMEILRVLRSLDLPDCRVFSGAVYQTALNHLTGRAADYGIKDYDVGYFDSADLSHEAEESVIGRVGER